MSLQQVYESFLATPNIDALAKDATLNYVTTLATFGDSAQIIKHLESQRKLLRKKSEKILNAIADRHALFLEVETVIEFLNGGGSYLPGLDDNFLTDQTVMLPIQHVVHFDSQSKIQQIRLYWDQGSLLKTIEVIGSRARNWPIRDGKDQIRLITSSANAASRDSASVNSQSTSRKPSSTRATKDPHATLEPFAAHIPEDPEDPEATPTFKSPPVAPRTSAKPPPRQWGELFYDGDNTHEDQGPPSPTKSDIKAPKIGAGKNFGENRLFGEGPDETNGKSPERYISPHPTKYNHFEFSDGHDQPAPPPSVPKPRTKHQSQWDFSDFTTPAKPAARRQDKRHFGFEEDAPEETPIRKPAAVNQPRRDAEAHFELLDDGEPQNPRRPAHPRGQGSVSHNTNLFQNNVFSEDGAASSTKTARPLSMGTSLKDRQKDFGTHWDMNDAPSHGADPNKPLGVVTNQKDRGKDFNAHWHMTDSPSEVERSRKENKPPLGENKSKAVKMMEANWEARDASPIGEKENRGIRTAGNGMGGRKDAGRQWGFGDDDQPAGLSERPKTKINTHNQPSKGGFWDF